MTVRNQPMVQATASSADNISAIRESMAAEVRSLSIVRNLRFVMDVVLQWCVIGLSIALAVWFESWVVYLLAILVIATRQHALGVLMHDGTHYRLLTNRTANDFVCDLLCALPVGMLTSRYRHEHLLHHRFLNTDDDPYWRDFTADSDWHWPKSKKAAMGVFARDLFGLSNSRIGKVVFRWSPWINHFGLKKSPPPMRLGERMRVYGFFAALLTALSVTNGWLYFLLLWFIPLSTLTILLIRIRTIAEHIAIPNTTELNSSRHVDGNLFEHLTLSPFNINYHIDHHMFASVPYYNLPKLHTVLLKDADYQRLAHLNPSYLFGPKSVLGQILRRESVH